MTSPTAVFQSNRLFARVLRSSSWLVLGYGASLALRLASNLILVRLLFPEAFGVMALITAVIIGLSMFSDVGITASIARSPRGDDPDFLNTAWTLQVMRGFFLWGVTWLLAAPVATLYDAPELAWYLPVAGLTLVVSGFNTTRIETANRHLMLGRMTALDLLAQLIGIVSMIVLAYLTESVWALVVGGIFGALAKLFLTHSLLPGEVNRFRWEPRAVRELITFGKWIFLSTAFWFVSSQGDKMILGKFLSLETLGIYNIGFFLASFPLLLGQTVSQKILIPIYREKPPGAAPENARRLHQMRMGLTGGLIGLLAVMALAGPNIVWFLYDSRYQEAGAMVVVIACALIPHVIGLTYDQAALAAGDSRRFVVFSGIRSTVQTVFLIIGVTQFGLLGAMISMGVATVAVHPVLVWLARTHRAWDPLHDCLAVLTGTSAVILATWLHRDLIMSVAM